MIVKQPNYTISATLLEKVLGVLEDHQVINYADDDMNDDEVIELYEALKTEIETQNESSWGGL